MHKIQALDKQDQSSAVDKNASDLWVVYNNPEAEAGAVAKWGFSSHFTFHLQTGSTPKNSVSLWILGRFQDECTGGLTKKI